MGVKFELLIYITVTITFVDIGHHMWPEELVCNHILSMHLDKMAMYIMIVI